MALVLWSCAGAPPGPAPPPPPQSAPPAPAQPTPPLPPPNPPPPPAPPPPRAEERPQPGPAPPLEAATQRAAARLRELAERQAPPEAPPEASELQRRYVDLLARPGTPESRKPEILLRLAELAYRDEEASLKGLYETETDLAPGSRYPRSIAYYRRLVDDHPESPQALTAFYNLGYLYAEEGKRGLSGWAYEEVLRRDPRTPYADEIHMRLGEAAFDGGEMEEAILHYRAVVERGSPEYVDKALYKLGWSFYNQNDFSRALGAFSGVMDRQASPAESLRRETLEIMARTFAESGGVEGVRKHLAAATWAHSYGDRLYRLLGDQYADASRYEDAAAAYGAGVDAFPTSSVCLAMEKGLLSALLILRDLEAANTRRESWLQRYGPGSAWAEANADPARVAERDALLEEGVRLAALYRHHQAQRGQGSLDRALQLYARYLELFPADTEERYELSFSHAQALKEAGLLEEAGAQYLAVATHTTRTAHREEASYRRIEILQARYAADPSVLEQLAAAQEEYANLNPDSPLIPKVLFAEGELYLAAERFPQARAAFSRVLEEHPGSDLAGEALERVARCHFREESYRQAEAVARQALAQRPEAETAVRARKLVCFSVFKQGEAAEAARDLEEANRHFLRVSQEFPEDEVAWVSLFRAAENLRALGKPAEAADVYLRVAQTYPGSPDARNALALAAEIHASLGRWADAARTYEALYRADPEAPKAAEVLYLAADNFERAGARAEGALLFGEFSKRYPSNERRAEALYREGDALRELGQVEVAGDRFREAWEARTPEGGDIYPARASLALGDLTLAEFRRAELKGDLEAALTRKEALLQQAMAYLAQAASLPYAETVTAALYRAGKAFEDMKEAILSSERPPDLTTEERAQYDFLLEEKAAPLEEKAIDYYRRGIAAARDSAVHTEWVVRMFQRLEALVPWAYQRPEETAKAFSLTWGDLPGPARGPLETTWGTPPASASPWTLPTDVLEAEGTAGAASEAHRKTPRVGPEDYAAAVNFGVLRLAQGDASGAEALFQGAAEAAPSRPEAWNNLGLARRTRGDYSGAREAFARALHVGGDFPPALKNLGILNEKYLGLPAQALPYYDRYLLLRPGDVEVERWRKAAGRLAQGQGGTP